MALKLLLLARRVLRTSPSIKIQIERIDIYKHKKNEGWTKSGAKAAGYYSKHVLWNKPNLKVSIDDINKKLKGLNVKNENEIICIHIYIYTYIESDGQITLKHNTVQHIYEYDNTYTIKVDKVLKQLSVHCFICRCQICFKPYNNCCCCCAVCKT